MTIFEQVSRAKWIYAIVLQVIFAMLAFILGVQCLQWALADIYAAQVSYHLEHVESVTPSETNIKRWQRAHQQLDKLLSIRPHHAEYLELAAVFYQSLDTLETQAPEIMDHLGWKNSEQQALVYARQALRLRPSWPYLWEELLLSKITLKQYDVELASAVERALTLGRWEQSIQYDLAILGLDHWQDLDSSVKQNILHAMNQVVSLYKPKSVEIKTMLAHENAKNACLVESNESVVSTLKVCKLISQNQ